MWDFFWVLKLKQLRENLGVRFRVLGERKEKNWR
jgi:hypothetical protein